MFGTTKRIPSATRKAVYERDGYACALCQDSRAIHLHHVKARGKGGKDTEENLICLCPACHQVVHGEYTYAYDFPFDQETAIDAIECYLSLTYEGGGE